MDNLPDDPATAFVQLERICRTRLNQFVSNLDRYEMGDDLRIEYMTVIGSAAQAYGVADLGELHELNNNNFQWVYRQAVSAATKLTIEAKRARGASSVNLSVGAKERLRRHLKTLSDTLEASDLPESRKAKLKTKLNSFSSELDKERIDLKTILVNVALVAAALNQGEEQ